MRAVGAEDQSESAGRRVLESDRHAVVVLHHPGDGVVVDVLGPGRRRLTKHVLPLAEWVLGALGMAGLDAGTTLTAYITLFNYIRGTAFNLELEAEAQAETGMNNDGWMDHQQPVRRALSTGGQFPTFSRLTQSGYDFSLDRLFEFGLQRLLDGLTVMVEHHQ
ncbi:MAG: TetR/AcrR family transcriptional regulator C-terminal domain-containing protein [Chloroflexi bacterium]|nr:TetR/AcrR family transcriptional regulator C-terminal domain-containing protein [Chloroflexota bacterium]